MKAYTRGGDKGETSLFGGERVSKDSFRIEAYGAVDELNSLLGYTVPFIKNEGISNILLTIQNDLFVLGGDLASPHSLPPRVGRKRIPRVTPSMTEKLEEVIDRLSEELPPLRSFVIPGGSSGGALLHLCRAVTRRAERRVVALSRKEEINKEVVRYLNRLSSLLFVLARKANLDEGVSEHRWSYEPGG